MKTQDDDNNQTQKQSDLGRTRIEEGKHTSPEKNPTTGLVVELFGPTAEFLTSPEDERNDFCVLKGTIPSGVHVPLHSHLDTEDFLVISGAVEYLLQGKEGRYEWIGAKPGDYIHVPANAHHAWRNLSSEPIVSLITTTKRMGRFFQEVGRPVMTGAAAPQPVTPADLARFAAVSARYGYWNATPEENAAVGIPLSF
jgi:quercetin dioxygenase-like cupin family protein